MRNEQLTNHFNGCPESILDLLEKLGPVPSNVQITILSEKNPFVLHNWFHLALHAGSLDFFVQEMSFVTPFVRFSCCPLQDSFTKQTIISFSNIPRK